MYRTWESWGEGGQLVIGVNLYLFISVYFSCNQCKNSYLMEIVVPLNITSNSERLGLRFWHLIQRCQK